MCKIAGLKIIQKVCLICLICCLGASISIAAEGSLYAIFITSDGFRPDYIEMYNPPNLMKLIQEGVRVKDAVDVFPWTTTANMTSLVTGSYPATTGIGNNSQYEKETDKIVGGPRDNKAETIGETLQKAKIPTAVVNHFMLQNRGADKYISNGTADDVVKLIQEKKWPFIAYYYSKTDSIGHEYGPYSKEMKQTVLDIDAQVGKIVAALKKAKIYDKTLIVFSSDHGMSAFETKQASIEPADALEKAGFKVATNQREIKDDTQLIVYAAGSRFIYLRKELTPEQLTLFKSTLNNIEGAELWDTAKIRDEYHAGPHSGDYAVVPLPGYAMSNANSKGGLHGRPTEKNTIMILRGPGIKKGAIVAHAENVDLVPTIEYFLKVAPAKTVDGMVIKDAFIKKAVK
jgi:predicted AlkP superfamily pyrophosphatase or phosphodiesterase